MLRLLTVVALLGALSIASVAADPAGGAPRSAKSKARAKKKAKRIYDKIKDVLGVDVLREDEMECLIIGGPPGSPLDAPTC